ncbi:hypothetical protein N0V95_009082 [Ascochyta clinopodiicola]|nr:hypothetical protein N0V95_009082 [Ascochyta clinopodiicola]
MSASKPRVRSQKTAPAKTKPKGISGLIVSRKRSSPVTNKIERAPKVRKTAPRANSGKRVNGRGASATDAFVISDDENDNCVQPRKESRTDSLTPPYQMLKADSPSLEDDLNPTPTYRNNLENELVCMKRIHAKELEQFHQQLCASLCASEAKAKLVREDADREAAELQQRQSILSDKQMANLDEVIEAERRRSSGLSWECDHLHRELKAASNRLVGERALIRERDEYKRLYTEGQNINTGLMHDLTEQKEETARKATAAADARQRLEAQMHDVQREVAQLRDENAALKAVSSSQIMERSDVSASPAPSQSPTTSHFEQRLANVRKTYVTVKRRYDSLYAVATNVSTTTRSWDYGNFGEVGHHLQQMNAVMDEIGRESQMGRYGGSMAKVE